MNLKNCFSYEASEADRFAAVQSPYLGIGIEFYSLRQFTLKLCFGSSGVACLAFVSLSHRPRYFFSAMSPAFMVAVCL